MNALILLFLIIFIIIYFNKKNQGKSFLFPSKKTSRPKLRKKLSGILSIYISILLLSVILSAFIPHQNEMSIRKVNTVEDESENLYDQVISGKVNKINQKLINKKWDRNYPYKQLNIHVKNNNNLEMPIIVERKTTNDNKIEGVLFKPFMEMDEFVITKKFDPYQLAWSDDTLTIIQPEQIRLKFSLFKRDFTVSQFTGDVSKEDNHSSAYRYPILYLHIPKDLKIVSDKKVESIEYIGD
ncbi:hypothetical protein ACQKCU_07205 [Heyndrickxia sporothermodurans]